MDSDTRGIGSFIALIVAVVFGLIIIFSCFGTISAGQVGVKTRFGQVVNIMQPGFYAKKPFIEQVHKMSVKTLTINMEKTDNGNNSLGAASKDLQDVQIGVVVNYHLDATKVSNIYQQYNSVENFQGNVIEPIIRQTVKAVSANYTAEELVTKRAEFSDIVNKKLSENFTGKDAILEAINITNLEFSASFTKAIEAKVTAEQDALAAKNKLAQTQYEADQKITTAEADAKAASLISAAANNEKYVQLKALEVQEKAIAKWNGVLPAQMIPGASMPFINVGK